VPFIVQTSLHEEIGDRVIFMNEVGEPLDLVCLCDDKKRKMIAGIVARDIRQFLDKLIEIGCGMVDLHPGNIVMVSDGTEMHAKVIDIESITALGTVFKGVARRSFFTLGADLKPTRETELLGLLLVVAWIVDWNSTRSAVNRDEWSRAEVALALAKLVANEKALNEIVPELKLINDK
jgi:hypothetical protein